MVSFYDHDSADIDTSAIVWKQHFGLSGDIPEEQEWAEIESWLQENAPQLKLPDKKDNQLLESIKRLKSFHEENIEVDRIIQTYNRQSQTAYQSEEVGGHLEKVMDDMGLSRNQLSTLCLAQLETLAKVASTLNLSDCRISSIQTAIASMTLERMNLQMEKDNMSDNQLDVRHKTKVVETVMKDMNEYLSSIRKEQKTIYEAEQHKWSTEMAVLGRKSEDYRKQVIALQKTYADRKIDDRGLVFSKLKSFQHEMEEWEETLEKKQNELQRYLGLPLDIKDAAAKLRSMYDTLVSTYYTSINKRTRGLIIISIEFREEAKR
ncbi:hypothetical protein NQZ79_g3268 [Umbelopsis isabellina]|nr:hypothetical protein NQZ79_g3268 [Umbelopsis isabellina]